MKKTMMKITSRVALTILLALTISQIHVAGQTKGEQLARDIDEILLKSDEAKGDHGLVGTWLVQVTVRNCDTGVPLASFPSLVTYARGGTMMVTSSSLSPALNYPAQGVWHYVGGQRYAGSYMFFRYNVNGSFAGTQKITQDIELDRHADELNITATFEVFDTGGNVIATGCATATGTRFQ